jgi:hypothetical protein
MRFGAYPLYGVIRVFFEKEFPVDLGQQIVEGIDLAHDTPGLRGTCALEKCWSCEWDPRRSRSPHLRDRRELP